MAAEKQTIIETEGLKKYYDATSGFIESLIGEKKEVKAVDGVDIKLRRGETLGVVGESGCGKTSLGRSILRLIEPTDGSVYYTKDTESGRTEVDLTEISDNELRDLRTDLQYIFQDPFSSLNPRLTVGDIIGEPLDIHGITDSEEERTERIHDLLQTVGLKPNHIHRYPQEFSGGQRQRIGIARALAVDPEVIICDEPVSALDVSVQAQILNLLEDLQEEFGLSYIFIAHDLSVVEHISDRIAVMYLGEIVEIGKTEEVFGEPRHPYVNALLSAIPEPDPDWEGDRVYLTGTVPSPMNPPSGCRFHTRCPQVIQPDKYSLEQNEWRSILDFRFRARKADSADGLLGADVGTEDTNKKIEQTIRNEFDLPSTVSDRQAESDLKNAIEQIAADDLESAVDFMESTFVTPCEQRDPRAVSVSDTHDISCLLFEDEYADQSLPRN